MMSRNYWEVIVLEIYRIYINYRKQYTEWY